jgi:U3 small nucleolar RNA-associated protein 20
MVHLHTWAMQKDKGVLRGVAVQVYGLVVDALQRAATPYLDVIMDDLGTVAESICESLTEEGEMEIDEDEDAGEGLDGEWYATYQMLQGLGKVLKVFPEATTEPGRVRWTAVVQLLAYPHAWVRSAACRLLGVLFAASTTTAEEDAGTGVFTHAGMRNVADKLAALLKSRNVEAVMALQAVKNLFFVGKWFAARLSDGDKGHESENEEQDEAEDDADDTQGQGRSDALPWLFSKLSYQARSAQIARRNKSTAPVRDTIFCADSFPLDCIFLTYCRRTGRSRRSQCCGSLRR